MKPFIVANWKMNPVNERAARVLFGRVRSKISGVRGVEIAIAPPFPYLAFGRSSRSFRLAGQDVFWENAGAYTGEISPAMLKDLGVRYVLLGHSERRRLLGEVDEMINRKVRATLNARLIPIIAVGEETRESQEAVPPVLAQQIAAALKDIPRRMLRGIIIAYEPVWAISTMPGAKFDTPDHATRRAIYIRKILTKILGVRVADTVRIIYGGSVRAKNAGDFLAHDIRGMEGLLVGGASLDADEFAAIVRSVGVESRR